MITRALPGFDIHDRVRQRRTRWASVFGAGARLTAVSTHVFSQELPPPIPALPAIPQPPTSNASSPTAPASVEQLAARLQAMEELNKKLGEQLEQTNREHDGASAGSRASRRAFATTERWAAECCRQRRRRSRCSAASGRQSGSRRRHAGAGLHRRAFFPLHDGAGVLGLEHVQRQEVAAEKRLQGIPVPDRGRGIWASIPPRVSA